MANLKRSIFIFMSQTQLESELVLFLGALKALGKEQDSQEIFPPAHPEIYELLSMELRESLPQMLPLQLKDFQKYFEYLSNNERLILIFRIHQLLQLIQVEADKPDEWWFAASPEWNHRWSEWIAGRVYSAQVDILDAGDFQP